MGVSDLSPLVSLSSVPTILPLRLGPNEEVIPSMLGQTLSAAVERNEVAVDNSPSDSMLSSDVAKEEGPHPRFEPRLATDPRFIYSVTCQK